MPAKNRRPTDAKRNARQGRATRTGTTPPQRKRARGKPAARVAVVPREPWLSPQRQREFFGLLLAGFGLLLLVLLFTSATSDAGAFGQFVALGMHTAFGLGAIVVPLLFIAVGALIVWQEHLSDAPISGANLLGVLVLAVVVLAMLETKNINALAVHDPADGRGGGMVGRWLDLGLVTAFGAAGTWTLLVVLGLLAALLTFNVTLRQTAGGLRRGLHAAAQRIIGQPAPRGDEPHDELAPEPVPWGDELKRRQPPAKAGAKPPTPAERTPAEALQDQLILTPIAARPTQAHLFEGRARVASAAETHDTLRSETPHPTEAETQRIVPAKPAADQPQSTAAQPAARGSKAKAQPAETEPEIAPIEPALPPQAWPLPPVELFDDFIENEVDDNEKRSKARVIEDTLSSFKIEAQVVGMNPGPAVTQYLLQPAVGVKVARITSLERDLALGLSAPSIRIEAPIPGTPYIGIEIPNSSISSVSMKEVIDTDEFRRHKGKLKLALGKDVSGTPVVTDLTRAPHLLIAGSTGTGKSIAINAIVTTLLSQHRPDELKFIMIDPKMVEMIVYNQIPHLLSPVVTELERVVSLLKWAVREMERRYKVLAQRGFRNIESYNKEAARRPDFQPFPYIVIIIDELADLMMMAPDEVETLICRIAQMARAIGIHLILATQRPSVDVVTGLIKANFPTRMAFAVTSQIDSRVILDTAGAEQLLGRGDMLYLASDAPKSIRVQGTFVSDREIEKIVTFWRAAQKPDQVNPGTEGRPAVPLKPAAKDDVQAQATPVVLAAEHTGVSALPGGMGEILDPAEQDELLPKAKALVKQHERASASLLQRRLRIGYSKAAQLIELLEQEGVLGPAEGSRSREVLRDSD